MPARLKFVVAYDGAPFAGWQSQPNRNGVQDYLERAFGEICATNLRVHGSGRTDAGVHALGQCAHVDLPDRRFTGMRWISAVNAGLPPTIRVLRCRYVSDDFHARFSARGKVYRYRIWNEQVLPPLEFGRAWHLIKPIDVARFRQAAGLFTGTHNFGGFAANSGNEVEDPIRTIHRIRVTSSGPHISVQFDGAGFLYKMVRLMVGACVEAARNRISLEALSTRLSEGDSVNRAGRLVAPACGLFLLRVRY